MVDIYSYHIEQPMQRDVPFNASDTEKGNSFDIGSDNSFTLTSSGKLRKRCRSMKQVSEEFSSCEDLSSLNSISPAQTYYHNSLRHNDISHSTTTSTLGETNKAMDNAHLQKPSTTTPSQSALKCSHENNWGWFVAAEDSYW